MIPLRVLAWINKTIVSDEHSETDKESNRRQKNVELYGQGRDGGIACRNKDDVGEESEAGDNEESSDKSGV